jgi:hypothetical protein
MAATYVLLGREEGLSTSVIIMFEESIMLVTTPLLDFVKHVTNTKHVLLLQSVKTSVK